MTLSTKKVIPTGPSDAKILIVGEAPGFEEDSQGTPFVGASGQRLWEDLLRYGISRDHVRVTNICNYRPKNNEFTLCLNTPELAEGLKELQDYIVAHPPNVIIALGEKAMFYLTGKSTVTHYRGSILPCVFNPKVKVIPTYHPAFLFRSPDAFLLYDLDLRRAIEQSKFPEFRLRKRTLHTVARLAPDTFQQLLNSPVLAVDIETTINKETGQIVPISIGFATSPEVSVAMEWNDYNEAYIIQLLTSPKIGKIFHYGFMFDIEFLYTLGITVQGDIHDTYILARVVNPGMPRTLGFLTSIYTLEPYYKTSGREGLPEDTKVWSDRTERKDVLIYNAKDCAVTFEIFEAMQEELKEYQLEHVYKFDLIDAKVVAQPMSRTGMLLDPERLELFQRALTYKWENLQHVLNIISGRTINVNSPKDVKWLLYTKFELPLKKTYTGTLTTGESALVSLLTVCQDKINSYKTPATKAKWSLIIDALKLIIDIRQTRKLLSSYANVDTQPNGRVLSSYNVGGTETGRWSAKKYLDITGWNAMTLPRSSVPIADDLPLELDKSEIKKKITAAIFMEDDEWDGSE